MTKHLLLSLAILAASTNAQLCKIEDLTKTCDFQASFTSGQQEVRLEATLTCPLAEDIPNVDDNQIPTAEEQTSLKEDFPDASCNCAAELLNDYDDSLLADAKTMNCQCFGCPAEYAYPYAFKCEAPIAGPCTSFDCEFTCNGVAGLESVQEQEVSNSTGCPVQENLEQCSELIAENSIPCRCEATDCMAFSNGKFADCVDGSTAFVSGNTASGCTLEQHAPDDFNCTTANDEIEQSYCGSEPCLIDLSLSCSEMMEQYTFQGSCCSMQDSEEEGCQLTVANYGNCFWAPKEGDCNKEDANCNIVFTTDSDLECPESEFKPLGVEPEDNENCGNNNCGVTLPITCGQLAEEYTFEGTCCSLAAVEEYGQCVVTVANEGSCMWYPNDQSVCDDELNCYIMYSTDSADACPESEFNVLGDNDIDIPDVPEINIECASAILLEAGNEVEGDHSTVDLVTEDVPACGAHGALPGLWYQIKAKANTTVVVHVCSNNDAITHFSVFANHCEASNCIGSPPVQTAAKTCGEVDPEIFSIAANSNGNMFVRVSAAEGETSNFNIWYEVEGEEVNDIEELLYFPEGDTTIVRSGELEPTEESLGEQETFLVQHSPEGSDLASTFALLEFVVDVEEIEAVGVGGVDLCLERVPRADIFDHTHTYSICVLDDTPDDNVESITNESSFAMPDDCFDGLILEFEVGPNTETSQCIDITTLLFAEEQEEDEQDPEEVSVETSGSQRNLRRKLQEEATIVLMIDNLNENDIAGDRWYSRESAGERLPPSLIFIPADRDVDPVPGSDCYSDGPNVICPAGGSFEVDGQTVLVEAEVSCPVEEVEKFESFEEASQVFGLCTCSVNVGEEQDPENPDLQADSDLTCNCYACPEGSVMEYAYDCVAGTRLAETCSKVNCDGECNGELDNIDFPQVDDPPEQVNGTGTPEKTLPPSTANPDATPAPTPVVTVASTTNSTEDDNSSAISRQSYVVGVIAMVAGWVAIM